ncbi:hypothetical protein RYX36_030232 [Vicia faba]
MHAAPMYIAETAPTPIRGLLISLKEFFIVIGMVAGYGLGSLWVETVGGWRYINCHIPTTLEGSFLPVTVPFDVSTCGNTSDLPDTDPRVRRQVVGFEPEQISLSLSSTHDSVWVSWITGDFKLVTTSSR